MRPLTALLLNTRFYILSFAFLTSVFIAALFRLKFPGDQLYFIRLEQLFGLLATMLVYSAVIITPVSKLLAAAPGIKQLLFARRGIGVAAAYFALLHVLLTIQEQLGGLSGVWTLPPIFKLSFGLGAIAFAILMAMAATSFDKAIKLMTFPRWKQLHRFVYLAGVLIVVHIWLIGTHVEYVSVQALAYLALGLLLFLDSLRLSATIITRFKLDPELRYAVVSILLVIAGLGLVLLSRLTQQYSASPAGHGASHAHHHEASE